MASFGPSVGSHAISRRREGEDRSLSTDTAARACIGPAQQRLIHWSRATRRQPASRVHPCPRSRGDSNVRARRRCPSSARTARQRSLSAPARAARADRGDERELACGETHSTSAIAQIALPQTALPPRAQPPSLSLSPRRRRPRRGGCAPSCPRDARGESCRSQGLRARGERRRSSPRCGAARVRTRAQGGARSPLR